MRWKTCDYCSEKINIKKEKFIKKYEKYLGHYTINSFEYFICYFHPWCWELEKEKSKYHESFYSDIDPNIITKNKILKAKKEYLDR